MIYGWIPDLPDQRDILYKIEFIDEAKLPPLVDLRCFCSSVEDQEDLGSCTANALVGALEVLEKKDKVWFQDFSRLFIYYNERAIEDCVREDSGAMIRDGIKTLAKDGVCSEKAWPYITEKFKNKPYPSCYKEALGHQITSYMRLNTLAQMKKCLADGFPFVFGFSVYESFESEWVTDTGIARMPKRNERLLGGHAVLAVGYQEAKKIFLVRNSWGTKWGDKGYFTMPYEYLAERNLSDDFWTIRRGEGM